MAESPPTESSLQDQQQPPPPYAYAKSSPEVDILFLGSPEVGKTTFLNSLHKVQDGKLDLSLAQPSTRATVSGTANPLSFDVTLFRRPYRFRVWRSTSTLFVDPFPSHPDFVVVAYAVDSRASLHNARFYWRKQFSLHYDVLEHSTPVMLLGLKRDLRTDEKDEETGQNVCVMPEEGLKAAQEMQCDRYAECSALTGELMWEVLEDITRTAAMTTTERGGLSDGSACSVM